MSERDDQHNYVRVKRALISVSDKAGIGDFATSLQDLGVEILSTGGTYRLLQGLGLKVTEVSDYTGFPEMMDGRVKTLHPKVHGGILARRGQDDAVMAEHGIEPIDMFAGRCHRKYRHRRPHYGARGGQESSFCYYCRERGRLW